jgi:hypothetical protein
MNDKQFDKFMRVITAMQKDLHEIASNVKHQNITVNMDAAEIVRATSELVDKE